MASTSLALLAVVAAIRLHVALAASFLHTPTTTSSICTRMRWRAASDAMNGGLLRRSRGGAFLLRRRRPHLHHQPCRRSFVSLSAVRRTAPTMMPEGPEVRTLVDQLQPAVGMRLVDLRFLSGRYVRHGPPRGFEEFRRTMTKYDGGAAAAVQQVDVVKAWKAKGKFIHIVLDDGNRNGGGDYDSTDNGDDDDDGDDFLRSVWVTLGMSGRFVSEGAMKEGENKSKSGRNNGGDGASPRWYLEFLDSASGRRRKIYYVDPRNFGTLRFSLSRSELDAKLRSLGPDILDDETYDDDNAFLDRMAAQRPALNVCKFLMDQSKISGVGNYILAEGLYRASIDPFAPLGELSLDQRRRLISELRDVARTSYGAQGLSRPGGSYRDAEGQRGKFEFELQCYGRDYCARGRPVLRDTNGPHGRTIWYVEDQLAVPRWARNSDGSVMDEAERREAATVEASIEGSASKEEGDASESSGTLIARTGDSVADLLQGLTDRSWTKALSNYTSTDDFRSLADFVASERESGGAVYPPEEDVFSALNLCPLDEVKVVIVGQDPYHGPGQGHGLAFSVRRGVPPPPSLKNIFREAAADVGIQPPRHGCLESWAEQGVLLLNAVLTVRRGEANSHAGKGWEAFTDEVIRLVNDRNEGAVFLLWGGPAQKKGSRVHGGRHAVLRTSHPSPLGATKTASPFLGSRCFSRTNEALAKEGRDPIDWTVR